MNLAGNLANIVTGLRIPFSLWMLAYPAFSPPFYVLYLICGVTDMIDGTIARKTNSSSDFGATLDSVADIVFAVSAFAKILPAIHILQWHKIWILIIAVVKTSSFAVGFFRGKHTKCFHSPLNKLTGFLLFLIPLTVSSIPLCISVLVVCTFATVAAIHDVYLIHLIS